MYCRYVTLIHYVLSIVIITGHELKLWNYKTCPSTYTVYTSQGKQIGMKVRDISASDCKELIDVRHRRAMPDLIPIVLTDFKNGQYIANITWEYTAKGKRLPKQFILNMTFYEQYEDRKGNIQYRFSNETCVILLITSGRKLSHTDSKTVTFYFDCLPLQGPEHSGLKVEVLIYPRKSSRRCRSVRSLPEGGSKKCGNSGVKCSQPINFGVTLDAHTYRQCACYRQNYGNPKLSWQRDILTNSIKITISNLPPYLKSTDLQVFRADNKKDQIDEFFETDIFKNDTVQVYNITEAHADGKEMKIYVHVCLNATLYAKCEDPGRFEKSYKQEIQDDCNSDGSVYVAYYKEFQYEPVTDESTDNEDTVNYIHIILILVGVFIVASTVVLIYVAIYRRRNNSQLTRSSRSQSWHVTKLISLCTDSDNDRTTTGNHRNSDDQSEYQMIELDSQGNNNQPTSSSSEQTTFITTPLSHGLNQSLLMYAGDQNDSQTIQEKVMQLENTLKDNCSSKLDIVFVGQKCDENMDVNLSSHYSHILLLITKNLHTFCSNMSVKPRKGGSQFHNCDIIQKVNKYTHPKGHTSFHVISFGFEENVSEFLTNHRFNAKPNCIPYYFTNNDVVDTENEYVLNQLISNICYKTQSVSFNSQSAEDDDIDNKQQREMLRRHPDCCIQNTEENLMALAKLNLDD
ncbi:hypothetical protein ACF0H5_014130 [Mactra antiquata]